MLHVITGTPRSGSTLLCNILNQRVDTFASSTSALPNLLAAMSQVLTNSPEVTADLANIGDEAEDRNRHTLAAVIKAWYEWRPELEIIDKSRLWAGQTTLLRAVDPDASVVCLVRDPRDILASIERRHRETGVYQAQGHAHLWERCSSLMSEEGTVGAAIHAIENLIRTRFSNVLFVDHAALAAAPEVWLTKIETTLDLEPHTYNFEQVCNVSTDLDAQYRGKFPHEGAGPVRPVEGRWDEVIPVDIAAAALERWPLYASTFGYD